jgi:hypothetical protein
MNEQHESLTSGLRHDVLRHGASAVPTAGLTHSDRDRPGAPVTFPRGRRAAREQDMIAQPRAARRHAAAF